MDVDIVIVGAGLVGTSVIVGLQDAGFRILILEKHLPAVIDVDKEDSRPLSLAYGGQQCLQRWGVWEALAASAMPIETLHVSEQGRLGRAKFSAAEYSLPALAYVVPFSLLQKTLYEHAAAQPDVTFTSIEKIHSIVCNEAGATLEYEAASETHSISAKLLIAADGAQSTCRQLLNIPVAKGQSDDVAFIATFYSKASHQGLAYQRFTKQGSFALLPLFDPHHYRLVWTMRQSLHEHVEDWSNEKLLKTISDAYGGRLGEISDVQRDAVFPLQMTIAEESIRPSAVLLGNAAHTIYPLAAQGFNLGLQDVAALTRILQNNADSIGALSTLERYVEQRESNQRAVIDWTKRVANVFHWRIPLLDHARGVGLLGLDALPMVKENFARNFLHV